MFTPFCPREFAPLKLRDLMLLGWMVNAK